MKLFCIGLFLGICLLSYSVQDNLKITYYHYRGCSWCDKMEKETLSDPEVKRALENVDFRSIDCTGHSLVRAYPCLVFSKGIPSRDVGIVYGYQTRSQMLTQIKYYKEISPR